MPHSNSIIYLYGYPGVGKRTIGLEICKTPHFRMFDNHTINNVLFPFVRVDGSSKIPEPVWDSALKIRNIALETMVKFGNRQFSYVFTNELYMNESIDLDLFKSVEDSAGKMNARFLPVRLLCEENENKKRIQNADRDLLMKAMNPEMLDETRKNEVFRSNNKNEFELDVTTVSPAVASDLILQALSKI